MEVNSLDTPNIASTSNTESAAGPPSTTGTLDSPATQITPVTLKAQIIEWVKFGILLIIIFMVVTKSVGITRVYGHSMDPTLRDQSWVAVNKLSTYLRSPKYGEVVIAREPGKGYDIIKRVIGVPGDTVAIQDGTVYVNDMPLPEIYTLGEPWDMEEVEVTQGNIFIMGDNRTPGESLDSRDPDMGQIPIKSVKGYVMISLFPMYRIMKPLEI